MKLILQIAAGYLAGKGVEVTLAACLYSKIYTDRWIPPVFAHLFGL